MARSSQLQERAILPITCLAAFLFFNSFGSIGVALAAIQKQFGNRLPEIQWVNLMGVVTIASLSFCFGRGGALLGQRWLYKGGVALCAAGAGLGAISASFRQLILARALGLAMGLPMSTAILAAGFDSKRRGQVLVLFASAIAVGRGGFLLQLGGWLWIFWMNFIVSLAVNAAVVRIFNGSEQRKEPFDIWGALTLLIGYPALLVGLTFGASNGWTSPLVMGSFFWRRSALRALCGSNYMRQSRSSTLVYSSRGLFAALATGFLAILLLSTALASPLSGRFADRTEASTVARIGLAVIVAGTVGTTTAVTLMEINASGDLWTHAAALGRAQQFAFTCLALVGLSESLRV